MTNASAENSSNPTTDLPICLQTLGGFSISVAGRNVHLRGTKDRALVAYLITNRNRTFTRDELASLLWGSYTDKLSRHSLNQAIYSIKRLIPGLLHVSRDGVRCAAKNITVDVETLTDPDSGNVTRLLSNIKGAFLATLAIQDSNEFEDWRSATNTRVFAAIDNALARAVPSLPLTEKRQLRTMPRELSEMLPRTFEVAEGMHVGAGDLDDTGTPSASGEVDGHESMELPFVGREAQLAVLQQELQYVQQNKPRCVVVSGSPGVGKTRLVEEFLNSSNARVCRTRCYEAERLIGFAPVVDLIRRNVVAADITGLDAVWRKALAQLVPQIDSEPALLPPVGEAAEQARLFEALLRLFSAMARKRPLIIFVDDAQWADRSTRALLSYLSNRLWETRCLIIATTRFTRKTPAPFNEWKGVDLSEFDATEIALLLKVLNRSTSEAEIAQITRSTGGHPYLLSEILQDKQYSTGALSGLSIRNGVRYFVQQVLQDLPKGAQHVAAALAAIGRPTSLKTLRAVAATARLTEELDLLEFHHLVEHSPEGITLRHDLLREAAYALTPLFSRKDFHRRAAHALVRNENHIGEAARHFLQAGEKRRAYGAAMHAAKNADQRHAYDESISFLKLAMHANPRSSLRVRPLLAQRLYRMNRLSDARGELRRAIDDAPRPELLLEYQVFFAELSQRLATNNMANIRAELRALRARQSAMPEGLLFRTLRCELRCSFHLGNPVLMEESVAELKSFAERSNLPDRYEALILAARTHAAFKSALEAEKWIGNITADVMALDNAETRIRSLIQIANVHYEAGKLVSAEAILREVKQQIERVGLISELPAVHAHLHMFMAEQGRFDEAVALYKMVNHQFKSDDSIYAHAIITANHAALLYEIGELTEAEYALQECLNNDAARESIWITLEVTGLQGLIFLKTGRVAPALACADRLLNRLGEIGCYIGDVSYLHMLISKAAIIRGDVRGAIARLESAIEQYAERDVVCRLRLELELARTLKAVNKGAARTRANSVFQEATSIGARPIADRADALLTRL